jgi:hypothetical protein
MDYRLMMALLNLLSVFYFYFKNIRAPAAFTGYLYPVALCGIGVEDWHFIAALWTPHLHEFVFVYFQSAATS